jgi:hypothetical protein
MSTSTHRWKLERKALAKEGSNIPVELANRATSREDDFKKVCGTVLIDTGAYRSAINEKVLRDIGLKSVGETRVRVVGGSEEVRPVFECYLRFSHLGDDTSGIWENNCHLEVVGLSERHAGFGILGRDCYIVANSRTTG